MRLPLFLFTVTLLALSPVSHAKKENSDKPANGRTADGKPDTYQKIYDATVEGKSLEEYFAAINGGWDRNLSTLRPRLDPARSYLVIHSQEPKEVFDIRSPNDFKRGMMSKGLAKLALSTFGIGHVFISWRCQQEAGVAEGTVGMTGELDNQFKKMLDSGWGLTTFVTNFTDGHLQTPALLDFEFEGEEPLHTLAIEVDPSVCGNAMGFVKKFLNHPSKPYENFGLQKDPVKFEGGGCGSFGMTVLDQSKIFGETKIIPNFWRHLAARTSLFGYGDLELPEDSSPKILRTDRTRKVSVAELFLLADWNASRRDGGQKVKIMDPELLLLFLKTVYRSFYQDLYASDRALFRELHGGALYQPRIAPSPDGDARVINGTFDKQSNMTVRQTLAWVKRIKADGFRARAVRVGNGKHTNVGVVLDRAN